MGGHDTLRVAAPGASTATKVEPADALAKLLHHEHGDFQLKAKLRQLVGESLSSQNPAAIPA
jgi:hypothetical protein